MPRLLLVVALVAAGFGVWYFAIRDRGRGEPSAADIEAAHALNTRGVGLMEQFKYGEAVDTFREVVEKHPRWIPGRVNLAIAILNDSKGESDEIAPLLEGVLKDEPDHPHANYTLGILKRRRDDLAGAYQNFEAVLRVDPNDAYSWLQKGDCHPDGDDSPGRWSATGGHCKSIRI